MARKVPVSKRFWSKVDRTESCWLWTASRSRRGYGYIKGDDDKNVLAHRLSYEWASGPIPDGLEVDHLCRVTSCVNPAHLEAVTPLENARRRTNVGTRCPKGHEYTQGNSMYDSRGYRLCRICRNAVSAAGKRRRRAQLKGTKS